MELLQLQHGDMLLREGLPSPAFYIVKQGTLVALRAEAGLLVYHAGDVVGLESAIDQRPSPFAVLANGAVEVLQIPIERFLELEQQTPVELRAIARHFLAQSEHALRSPR